MEDEVQHPISRNLFRQSSIETPLTPSIPSDSDSDDGDQKILQSQNKRDVVPKEELSQKNDRPILNASSMDKLRDRFEHVGMIKVIPEGTAAGSADMPDYVNVLSAGDKIKENQQKTEGKIKPTVKPKTMAKKPIPQTPTRSESLQKQITSTNAMIIGELKGLHSQSSRLINFEGKNVPENAEPVDSDQKKVDKTISSNQGNRKPEVISETAKSDVSKKMPPPPVNARSNSLQKQLPNVPLMGELRNKCGKSGPIKAAPDVAQPSSNILETVDELDDDMKTDLACYTDRMNDGKADKKETISTIKVMASPRPKSPRPVPVSAKKDEKEESFWEKIGTLGRKKRIKEVQDVQEEGKYAIDSPGLAANPDMPPEEYTLDENEERSMTEPRSLEDPKLQELIFVLIEWINDELADQRIIVKDIAEDLYDGQVLQKLLERLTGGKLDVPEVTQSEEGQKQKLAVVLSAANRVLDRYPPYKWSVDSVHSKNIVSILHLLVGLARQFRAPVRLPERVAIQMVVVRKKDGQLIHRTVREEITSTYEDLGMRCERDAFDTLFDHAPEKLAVVKKSLVSFVNKHLSKVHLEVTELDTQFHDGVFLTLLLGLLEGFFVPLGSFHLTPKTHDQKVHNVSFAFDLMQEIGLAKPKARPEDIVNLDLKSTLRVLYNLFTKYKGMN